MQTLTSFTHTNMIELSASITANSRASKAASGFDDILLNAENKLSSKDFAASLLEKISLSISQNLSSINAKGSSKNTFPFTNNFVSVFGDSGPLIDFINDVTIKLGLNATQNAALQQIAVNNKDATRSPESIAKIAAELKQAGITA